MALRALEEEVGPAAVAAPGCDGAEEGGRCCIAAVKSGVDSFGNVMALSKVPSPKKFLRKSSDVYGLVAVGYCG